MVMETKVIPEDGKIGMVEFEEMFETTVSFVC